MSSLPKLAVVSVVVVAIGALQLSVPAFTSKQNTPAISQATSSLTKQQHSDQVNQSISDDHNAQSGTLYFIPKQFNQGRTEQQHLLRQILQTKVDIKVTSIIARTKLTQTFKNVMNNWVNALYVFPLSENAAVDYLLTRVGERKIEGKIRKKSEAKKIIFRPMPKVKEPA
jgi:Ca-activated chloride channel family protein